MRYTVAGRVAHLVFARTLLDTLHLIGKRSLNVVVSKAVLCHQLHTLYVGLEIVARMFHISTHAEVLARLRLCQPILSLDVVFLLFVGAERRSNKAQACVVGDVSGDVCRSEISAEHILLVAVEVDAERLYVFHRSELRFSVDGLEVVVVDGDVAKHLYRPPLVGLPREVSLIVEEVGVVFTLGIHGTQQVPVGLVAQAIAPSHLFVGHAYVGTRSEQTCRDVAFQLLRTLIAYVEGRRHLVAVFCFETACREAHTLHHVGVDDRESFLLSATHEEWTVYLHIVNIYEVLVERAASHVILRRQFVVGAHAGLTLYHLLHGIARGRWRQLDVFDVELLGGGRLPGLLRHGHLAEHGVVLEELYLQRLLALWIAEHTFFRLISYHREAHHHRILRQ